MTAGSVGSYGNQGKTSAGLRDRARRAMRAEVGAIALALFAEQGFDSTTVDEIARAADMSRTSFFRYFATKEDVLLSHLEERGDRIAHALAARPDGEDPWASLRSALLTGYGEDSTPAQQELHLARMLQEVPSLRMRHLEKQLLWQDLFAPEVARRLGAHADDPRDPRPRALVAAALSCLDAARLAWAASGGTVAMPELIGWAMDTLAPPQRSDRDRTPGGAAQAGFSE